MLMTKVVSPLIGTGILTAFGGDGTVLIIAAVALGAQENVVSLAASKKTISLAALDENAVNIGVAGLGSNAS